MENILKKLQILSESDFYPYHMPGHKRNGAPSFAIDITEIDGFDNLHHAVGMLKEAQERAARLYGSLDSFFLVNGSTCGLLVAIFASFSRGDRVLVARNCHKAVYHALEIRGLKPVYVYPKVDDKCDICVGITAKQVAETLRNYDTNAIEPSAGDNLSQGEDSGRIKGMILTSPTYEGITSEIKEIAELLHRRDMILIVDEAHGAHFGFHEAFPESAVKQGADLVIQSLHKTLPSMTQTALLHRCSLRVDSAKIQKYLGVFQTSSPSYVFMAYMDECMGLLERQGKELFQRFVQRLDDFYKRCSTLEHMKVRKTSDPGKIVISAGGFYTGKELYDILRERYRLQPEMCAGCYVLAIATVCDTDEGFKRLYRALEELDGEMKESSVKGSTEDKRNKTLVSLLETRPEQKCCSWEMEQAEKETLRLADAAGKISAEYIYLYPPGIPFIVPGEVIGSDVTAGLLAIKDLGYELQGMSDVTGECVQVKAE